MADFSDITIFEITEPVYASTLYSGHSVYGFTSERCVYSVTVTDFSLSNIDNYGVDTGRTYIELDVSIGQLDNINPGDLAYLFVESGSGYVGNAVVYSATYPGGLNRITFTEDLGIGTTSIIYADDYAFFPYIAGRAFYWKVVEGATDISTEVYFSPNPQGVVHINVGPVITDYLEDNYDDTIEPQRNKDSVSILLNVRHSDTASYTASTNEVLVTNGVKPFRDVYGDSLENFIVEKSGTDSGGRHIDRFFSRKYDSDVSAVLPNYIFGAGRVWRDKESPVGRDYWKQYAYYFIDDNDPNYSTFYIESNDIGEDGSFLRSGSATSEAAGSAPSLFSFRVRGNIAFEDQFWIETVMSGGAARGSQIRRCLWEVREEPDNPVMVYWRNSLGTMSYWVFGYNRKTTRDIKNGGTFAEVFIDTSRNLSPGNITPDTRPYFQETITVSESSLNIMQATALREILTSREVYINLGRDLSDEYNIRVIPVPNSLQYEARNFSYNRRFTANAGSPTDYWANRELSLGTLEVSLLLPYNTSFDSLRVQESLSTVF